MEHTQRTDTWTKPKGAMIEDGRWGCMGSRGVEGGKWRQVYLNNNKNNIKKNKDKKDSIWFITIVPFKFSDLVFTRLYFCNNSFHFK